MTRSNQRSWIAFAALSFVAPAALIFGCSGPPVTTTLGGEPVCADYSIGVGGPKLRGGLQFPVRITVLDDDDPVAKALVYGKRAEADPSPRINLPDKNAEYKVEWAQCPNERATVPTSATKAKSLRDSTPAYECGEAKVYKTEQLVTKKGDPASHVLIYQAPPKPDCWADAKPVEAPDAGAPDVAAAPAEEAADAAAADAEASDAGAADAEASDAASASDAEAAKPESDKPEEKKAEEKPAEKKAEDKPAEPKAEEKPAK